MDNGKYIKKIAGMTIKNYNLIEEGDNILVAMSGGKDSYAMFDVLSILLKKSPVKFHLFPVAIDPGYPTDFSGLLEYVSKKDYSLVIKKTKISEIVKTKEHDNSGSYCFMCSRLRRGVLYKTASELKCNKIALGHNLDDAIATYLMNIFYSSNIRLLRPKYVSDKGITVIRPLIEVSEPSIISYAKEKNLPLIKIKCPLKETDSKRKKINDFISEAGGNDLKFYDSIKKSLRLLYKKD